MPLFKLKEPGSGGGGGGDGCLINVADSAGATLGEKLTNAVAALPAEGGVLDCRCLTGAQLIDTTVTIDKKVELLFGASEITVTAAIGIILELPVGVGELEGATGSVIIGSGPYITKFLCDPGTTGIWISALYCTVRDLEIQHTGADESNTGLLVDRNLGAAAVPELINIENVQILGSGKTGAALATGEWYVGTVIGCQFRQARYGWYSGVGGRRTNAVAFTGNRFFGNHRGIHAVAGEPFLNGNNAIEGNDEFGAWIECGKLHSVGNYWEQHDCPSVAIKGVPGNLRWYSFVNELFTYNPSFAVTGNDIVITDEGVAADNIFVRVISGASYQGFTANRGAIHTFDVIPVPPDYGVSGNVTIQDANTWRKDDGGYLFGDIADVASAFDKVRVRFTSTLPNNVLNCGSFTMVSDPSANANAVVRAVHAAVASASGNTFTMTNLTGVLTTATHAGTNTLGSLRGMDSTVINSSTGTVVAGRCYHGTVTNTGLGALNTGIVFYAATPVNDGGGTMISYFGLYIEDPASVASVNNFAINTVGGEVLFNSAGGAYNVTVETPNDATCFKVNHAFDAVSIGASAPLGEAKLSVRVRSTAVAGNIYCTSNLAVYAPSANSAGSHFATRSEAEVEAANASDISVAGAYTGTLDHQGTGTITTARIYQSILAVAAAGNVASAAGYYTRPFLSSSGNLTTWRGFYSDLPSLSSTGAITNFTNFDATAPTSGTFTLWRGLYISDPAGATITTAQAVRTDGGNIVLNENGGAWGVRAEVPGVTNAFVLDGTNSAVAFGATTNSTSWVNITQPINTSGVKRGFHYIAAANTGQTTTSEVNDVYFDLSRTTSWASGAITTQRAVLFDAPTYSVAAGVSQVITTAATVAIAGAPTVAADGTSITESYSLWVQAGRVLADGGLLVGAEPTGVAGKVGYTNTVDDTANSVGVGTILFKGATSRNSSGFLKIMNGTTAKYVAYFDAITG